MPRVCGQGLGDKEGAHKLRCLWLCSPGRGYTCEIRFSKALHKTPLGYRDGVSLGVLIGAVLALNLVGEC